MSLRLSAARTSLPAVGPSGTTFIPRVAAEAGEPLEQLGRIHLLDDDRQTVPEIDHPPTGPLPAPEVRKREDHAVVHTLGGA